VPMFHSKGPPEIRSWREGELAAVDLNTVRNGPRELRARTYARNMLWPQSPLRTAVADVDQPDRRRAQSASAESRSLKEAVSRI